MTCNLRGCPQPSATPNRILASLAVCLPLLFSACTQDAPERVPRGAEAAAPAEQPEGAAAGGPVELVEAEYKTVRHPDKRFYATIQPDGLQVSFMTVMGNFGSYTFPMERFVVGQPAYLSCPGSPDLLPLRVVRLQGDANQRYRIEWLPESPVATDGASSVVRSY
jgi:hypothetical protein